MTRLSLQDMQFNLLRYGTRKLTASSSITSRLDMGHIVGIHPAVQSVSVVSAREIRVTLKLWARLCPWPFRRAIDRRLLESMPKWLPEDHEVHVGIG